MKIQSKVMVLAISAILGGLSMSANAALTPFKTFTGKVGLSTDGFGSLTDAGTIEASVPAGSTVMAAYLYSSTFGTLGTPAVTLDGMAAAFGPRVANTTACCSLASFRADVTSIVKTKIEAGPGGVYSFDIAETSLGGSTDGEALVIVYSNAALPTATVGILDGFASVTGDTAIINFAAPLDPTDPGFFADMRLGIGFSCCGQRSTVKVNGALLTENAGNYDDDQDGGAAANGRLITVGSFDDPVSPVLPSYEDDHERYDLSSFVALGDTKIKVDTVNASADDNIFLATFHVSGEASITPTPVPEPASLLLLGAGLLGLSLRQRKSA